MILGFKQTFPDNTPTNFEHKIITAEKIHSMREGDRWRPGMSIQMAYGVRTKNYRQFNKGLKSLSTCKSTQDVFMTYDGDKLEITIDFDNHLKPKDRQLLIENDGLTKDQFLNWFFPKGKNEWIGQIIHWTNFQYKK